MKKIFTFLMLLCLAFSLHADWSWGGDLSLEIFNSDPLYKESRAYPFSNDISFQFFMVPKNTDYIANTILVTQPAADKISGGYREIEYEPLNLAHNMFWQLKAGANVGFLRLSYKDIVAVEGYLYGSLNTVHGAYGAIDALGHDGQYGAGVAMQLFNQLTFRVGFHHFSGHWADEVVSPFYGNYDWRVYYYNQPTKGWGADFFDLTEYTRNNSTIFDVSYEPVKYFKIMAELEVPNKKAWIRPAAHVPSDSISPAGGTPLDERLYTQEGFFYDYATASAKKNIYPDSFQAYRVGLGAEFTYPLENLGYLFVAGDVQLHQDGKINLDTLEYEEDRPWDFEYTVSAGIMFEREDDLPELGIVLTYHDGRFPLLNYFFQDSKYLGLSIRMSM